VLSSPISVSISIWLLCVRFVYIIDDSTKTVGQFVIYGDRGDTCVVIVLRFKGVKAWKILGEKKISSLSHLETH